MYTEEERAKWREGYKRWKETGESPWKAGRRTEPSEQQKAIEEWSADWKTRTTAAGGSKVLQRWNATGSKPKPESSREYTKRRMAEETKRTWLSDAAEVAQGVKEGSLAMSPYTALPYFGAKVGQDVLNGNVGVGTALNTAFAIAPFMPKFVLRKPVVDAANSANLNTDGGVFKTTYRDVPTLALNDNINPLGESVYLYEHPETTGSVAGKLSSYLPNEWFNYNLQSLTGYAKIGFNALTSLYKSPEYLQRVLGRFCGNLYKRDMFLKGLEDRLANVKVSQPKYIIRKDSPGKYKYVDDPNVTGMSSGDRILVLLKEPETTFIHEFGHASDRPLDGEIEYFTNEVNLPYLMKSKLKPSKNISAEDIEYHNRLRELRLRVLVGLRDMQKRGLPINDERAIQNYLGLEMEELPSDVQQLLEYFDYSDVVNAFKHMLGFSAPVGLAIPSLNKYAE